MQTNNKWEEEFMMKYCGNVYLQEVEEDFRGYRGCYNELVKDISKIETDAFNRGKEERKSEWIKKTEAYYWKDIIPLKIKETHQETLEKVKEVIGSKLKEKLAILKDSEYNTGFEDSLTDLLQELNNI